MFRFVLLVAAIVAIAWAQDDCKKFPAGDPTTCCAMTSPIMDENKDCFKEKMQAHECATDCIFNSTAIFDGDDVREKLSAELQPHMIGIDAESVPVFEAALDVCVDKLNGAKGPPHGKAAGKCSWKAMRLTMCMSRELFVNCPAKSWSSNTECDDWKQHIQSCSKSIPMHRIEH